MYKTISLTTPSLICPFGSSIFGMPCLVKSKVTVLITSISSVNLLYLSIPLRFLSCCKIKATFLALVVLMASLSVRSKSNLGF